jgi:hypothetical protein
MPWSPSDAERHTKQARGSPKAARAFAHAANYALKRGLSEGAAVRIGNFAARRTRRANRRSKRA